MHGPLNLTITSFLLALITGCGEGKPKTIQEALADGMTVSVLNDTGTIRSGKATFMLEFRRAADHQLTDPGNVKAGITMPMEGMEPMVAPTSVASSKAPGRYDVTSDISMAGAWLLTVTFGNGQRVPIKLSVLERQ